MCFFNEDDLREMISDPRIFPRFDLTDRQRQVLVLRLLHNRTFRVVGKLTGNVSRQRARQIYSETLEKMKPQFFSILREEKPCQAPEGGHSEH